jgi:hypothetical protein
MANYQVAVIKRPKNWKPECPDDVPLELAGPVEVLATSDDLFEAVERAIEHNENPDSERRGRWAVVLEPGVAGRFFPSARICTPIVYKVTAIWWPDGWEPNSPLDVPNCIWQAREQSGGEWLGYSQAEATMMALNRQCMDRPGSMWHVVVALENEAVSRTITYDPAGTETTVEVRRLHVVRPEEGGRGDCAHCPAHHLPCSDSEWTSQVHTVSARHNRSFEAGAKCVSNR